MEDITMLHTLQEVLQQPWVYNQEEFTPLAFPSPPTTIMLVPFALVHAHHHAPTSFVLHECPLPRAHMHEDSHELRQPPLRFVFVPTILGEHTSLPIFQVA
jgi:hypothetical protein